MRFWDSSALGAMILEEPEHERLALLLHRDADTAVWWSTRVECEGLIVRARRDRRLTAAQENEARSVLGIYLGAALEIDPSEDLRCGAIRLLASYALRAADALQLAAALVWCRGHTNGAGFVCLDDRLREAAAREGFTVLPYPDAVHEP